MNNLDAKHLLVALYEWETPTLRQIKPCDVISISAYSQL